MENAQDTEHLRLLSIFQFIFAGLVGLFSLFPLIHLLVGIGLLSGAFDQPSGNNPPPDVVGWIFIIVPSVIILMGLTMAACVAMVGRNISKRRGYVFCLLVSGLECCFMPIGTLLGIFTLIVLTRPSVKQAFGQGTVQGFAPTKPQQF